MKTALFVKPRLCLYKRFIDDIIGIWIPHENEDIDSNTWLQFQADINNYHGLEWEFTHRTSMTNYMDLTISLRNNRVETTLYEKELYHTPLRTPTWRPHRTHSR